MTGLPPLLRVPDRRSFGTLPFMPQDDTIQPPIPETQPPESPLPAPPALWRNVSFHLLWSSTFASGFGDRMAMFAALALLGYAGEGADNSSIQSGIDFFFFLPYLLWSPIAGWLTDRLPRKWVLFAADELRGLFVLAAFAMVPAGAARVAEGDQWMVWTMIGAIGVAAATFVPAKLSVVPNVVGFANLTRANAAVVAMGIIGNLIGFILGGWLADRSVSFAILVASGCYVFSGFMWVFLRTPWRKREKETGGVVTEPAAHGPIHVIREIIDGIRYAWRHRVVRVLILAAALVWAGTAVYLPALAVVNVELYQGDIASLGLLMAPVGLGMLLGAVVLGMFNMRLGSEVFISLGLVGCGLFIGLQMIVPSFGVGVLIALGTGVSAGVLLVPLNTLLQRVTADHIRGRVFAAKEILVEFGKVVIAGVIWQVPNTDPAMRPLGGVLAVGLVGVAVYGAWRYVLHGPIGGWVLNMVWRLIRLWADAVHRMKAVGRHHVPRTGPVLLVSNHTAGVDPLLIQAAVPRLVRWMMAEEYMFKAAGWLWSRIRPIGVRRGERDAGAAREAVEALRAGDVVGIFPEGGIDHDGEGLRAFGAGVGMIARRGGGGLVIVPVHLHGTPRARNPLRSFIRPSRSRVVFGEPFTPEEAGGDRERITAMIRQRIDALAPREEPEAKH